MTSQVSFGQISISPAKKFFPYADGFQLLKSIRILHGAFSTLIRMLIKQNVNNDVDKDSCINWFLTYPGCSGGLLVKTDEF